MCADGYTCGQARSSLSSTKTCDLGDWQGILHAIVDTADATVSNAFRRPKTPLPNVRLIFLMSQTTLIPPQPEPVYSSVDSERLPRRISWVVFWIAITLVSAIGVFLLPFAAPPRFPTFSNSYPYGFNNRLAQFFAVGASVAVLLILWSRRYARNAKEVGPEQSMPRRCLYLGVLAAVLFTALLGAAMIRANVFYSDAAYFITQIGHVLRYHAELYRDVEFAYGPILFYWPAGFQKAFAIIGISPAVSYLVTLATMQVMGLGMLFYVLEWLPLSRRIRIRFFALCAFATLTPLLGANYTLLRFLLPHTIFLAITQRRSLLWQSILFAAGELAAFCFSPELGVAFLGGVGCYAVYRALKSGWTWIAAAVPSLLALALYTRLMGHNLNVMGHFAAGAYNLVVAPDFHIVVLLIAAIVLSPICVVRYLVDGPPTRAARFLGFYVISLAMLGPALGRCDSLHTFFGGLGVYLLSLVGIEGMRPLPARLWVGALSVAIICSQVDNVYIRRGSLARMLLQVHIDRKVDINRLEALTNGHPIATPVYVPQDVCQELVRRDQYEPSYFLFMGGVWTDDDERRKIAELRQSAFALVPNWKYETTHDDLDETRKLPFLHTHIAYRERFAPWVQGVLLANEVREHWTLLGSVGSYSVYRQNGR
jgi:hypothetical protein